MKRVSSVILLSVVMVTVATVRGATINVPADQPTIQAAIEVAERADTVIVADGTYMENLNFKGQRITVQSLNGPEACFIDGSAGAAEEKSTIHMATTENAQTVLDGFSIINGNAGTRVGGGILLTDVSPTIRNCVIYNNQADDAGGMYVSFGAPAFYDCVFVSNNAVNGSAGAMIVYGSEATFTRCNFSSNSATETCGAIYLDYNATVLFRECTIENNTAEHAAGISVGWSTANLVQCTIRNNTAADGAGGVSMSNSTLKFDQSIISGNTSPDNAGGIRSYSGSLTMTNCVISDNIGDDGAALHTGRDSVTTLLNCEFTGNSGQAAYGRGGAINVGEGEMTLFNCLIADNESLVCGGIYCDDGSPLLVNCTITGNYGKDYAKGGGGVYSSMESNPELVNCIVWGNTVRSTSHHPEMDIENGGQITASYSNIGGTGWSGTGNISVDPIYTAGPSGNWYLGHTAAGQSQNSPCIDAGRDQAMQTCLELPLETICLDSYTTRTDGSMDTGTVDMGFHYPSLSTSGSMTLLLDDLQLAGGDTFHLHYNLANTGDTALTADIWILLDVYGYYWCYPSWVSTDDGIDYLAGVPISAGATYHEDVLEFIWPSGVGQASGLQFLGVAVNAGTFVFIGELQVVGWEYL